MTLVKAHRGFYYHRDYPASARKFQNSRSNAQDSWGVVISLPGTEITGRRLGNLRILRYKTFASLNFNIYRIKTINTSFQGAGQTSDPIRDFTN